MPRPSQRRGDFHVSQGVDVDAYADAWQPRPSPETSDRARRLGNRRSRPRCGESAGDLLRQFRSVTVNGGRPADDFRARGTERFTSRPSARRPPATVTKRRGHSRSGRLCRPRRGKRRLPRGSASRARRPQALDESPPLVTRKTEPASGFAGVPNCTLGVGSASDGIYT